jgi:tRNA A37 threonylcarbamoyltransferase TsaD
MYKVFAVISDDDEYGETIDEYTKYIHLPFPPNEGLPIEELHRRSKITSVFYSIEDEQFRVRLEGIRCETFPSNAHHNKEVFKRLLLENGWEHSE